MTMADLHVWTDEEEFVIAASPEDADAVMRDMRYDGPPIAWWQMPDDRPFTYCPDNDEATAVKKTCAEWCAEKGRGYFCSANY
jgi:hypothetical protein